MKILVVGATGVLGRHVIPRLLERGHAVRALVRRPEQQAEPLTRLGAESAPGDILDPASLLAAAHGYDAVLHLATAIPKPGGARDWSRNDRVRREGTANLLAAARATGVRRYVQQSIIFLYGDQGQSIATEATPLNPAPFIQSASDMEDRVRASDRDWCILRGGAFYGPGTGAEDGWYQAARAGTLRLPGDGAGLTSLIRVVDMAQSVVLATEKARPSTTYNVVDDEPVSYRTLYTHIAASIGAAHPTPGGPPTRSLGCSNARLRAELGWTPAYPTYRSGLI